MPGPRPILTTLVPSALRARLRVVQRHGRRLAALLSTGPAAGVPQRRIRRTVWALLDRGDPLGAHALAAPNLAALDPATHRQLWHDLEQQGYLARALEVARQRSARGVRERARLARLRGQLAVLSGDFTPVVPPPPDGYTSHPDRVLHLVTNALPAAQTGYTLRTHYIARSQAAAGLEPHVVAHTAPLASDAPVCEMVDGIAYHRLPGPDRWHTPLDDWLSAHVAGVAALVRRIRPAVLHAASDYLNAMTAEAVGRAYGIPVVYESRGFWEETWLSRLAERHGWDLDRLAAQQLLPDAYVLRRELEDRCRRAADRVVTLSAAMADRIAAGGVDRDRIVVVPNAVDVDAFPVLTRDQRLAGQLQIPPDATVIGYVSSLNEYEGIDTLISAYALIKPTSGHDVRLLIVGDGQHRRALERHAATLGLTDVIFAGRVPHADVLRYYSLIDLFVVPRKPVEVAQLVTPLKPYEAFATGRTVVMSNVRALAAIAEQSGAAELFEAGDEQSLARVLIGLLHDPGRRERLARAGAEWVRTHASWSATAQIYRRIYEELRPAGPPPGGTGARLVGGADGP